MELTSDVADDRVHGAPAALSLGRLQVALEGVRAALQMPARSIDAVRRAVVRYATVAHEQAFELEDMLATLTRAVDAIGDAVPEPQRAEVLASVQWWAVHGYHRAD